MATPRFAHQAVLYTSAIISVIGNGLLISVVLHRRSRFIGSYRILLVVFACMDITVSTVHACFLPVYVQIEYGVLAFMWDALDYSKSMCSFLNSLGAWLFYECFPLLMCHFAYRYLAVTKPDIIHGHAYLFYFAVFLINVSFAAIVMFDLKQEQRFFDEVILSDYGINMRSPDAPPMLHLNYWHSPKGGLNWNSLRVMLSMGAALSIILVASGWCIWGIVHALGKNSALPEKTKRIQLQLFRALMVQFAVPIVLCVVPFGIITLAPLTGRRYGQAANLIGMLVSIFPAVDPFMVLISMPRFRRILLGWFAQFQQCIQSVSMSTVDSITIVPISLRR